MHNGHSRRFQGHSRRDAKLSSLSLYRFAKAKASTARKTPACRTLNASCTPHPETAAQRFVRRFLFSPVSGRAALFHKCFTFCSFGSFATTPFQAVTAVSQLRFKSVSRRPAQIPIFYHFPVFLCYLSGLSLYFLDIPSNFQCFFKHSPSC